MNQFEQIRIKGLNPKWKSRVAKFGDEWFIFKDQRSKNGAILITEKPRIVGELAFLGTIGAWVSDGKEIQILT